MVTLKDISEITGVSISTVSRVLNNRGKISEETKRLVLGAADELMFKKGVVSQKTGQISYRLAIFYPNKGEYFHNDPSSSSDIRSIQSELLQKGHTVELIPHFLSEDRGMEKLIESINRNKIDSFILSDPPPEKKVLKGLEKITIPFIITNGIFRSSSLNQIDFDNYSGMKRLSEYILSKGHRKIGILMGPENRSVNRNRVDGLKDAFKELNLKIDSKLVKNCEFSMESGYAGAKDLLAEKKEISALICFSDYIALGAMKACKETGFRIPDDISIVGFDDISFSEFSDPPLTTVKRHSEQFYSFIAKALHDLIKYGDSISSFNVLFNTELINRHSG
ncbi:substrate-binding domain-containing protein [Spirochaeta isovalerica]|uniref:LacI family transcriptional regulator/LacI family repressor for deo operon, udp, cdd, tsx, nupC, and nupG n=1 Tax=Spirochaeta isovalerica TaxID=150 RepID=A0A841R7D2_9SPIO|nr:LacI family transcriptional regulator/LacI family repressor for deo operon, udp, cdd, tsx, nupC, and nupG [Spirochaeta isovalerica]